MRSNHPDAPTWILTLGVAVVGANSLALSPILGDVATSLAATPVEAARANAAYGGATAASALLLAGLIDKLGLKLSLLGGLASLALAMAASAAATNWVMLVAAQIVAGAAAGVVLPTTYALATVMAPKGDEARTLGRVLTGWAISLVVGVPLFAFIASASSWRAGYVVLAGLIMLAGFGLSSRPIPAGVEPTLDGSLWSLLRQSRILRLLLVCFLFMTAFYGTYAFLGDHVRHRLGLDATSAGFVVLAYGLGFGAASMGDRIIDRVDASRLLPIVLAILALVYGIMGPATGTLIGILAVAAAWGFIGHFGLNIIVLRLTQSSPGHRGAVLALNSATSYLGALAGVAASGAMYQRSSFPLVTASASGCLVVASLVAATMMRKVSIEPHGA